MMLPYFSRGRPLHILSRNRYYSLQSLKCIRKYSKNNHVTKSITPFSYCSSSLLQSHMTSIAPFTTISSNSYPSPRPLDDVNDKNDPNTDDAPLSNIEFNSLLENAGVVPIHDMWLIVAVSGGLDSICLSLLVDRWAKQCTVKANTKFVVVDHSLRSNSTDEALYVANWLKQRGLDSVIKTVQWRADATMAGLSLVNSLSGASKQVRARYMRYKMLREVCQDIELLQSTTYKSLENRPPIVLLTAHHEGDQAETLLIRLTRCSGLKGLSGIPMSTSIHTHSQSLNGPRPDSLHDSSIYDDEDCDMEYSLDGVVMAAGGRYVSTCEVIGPSTGDKMKIESSLLLLRPLLTVSKSRLLATATRDFDVRSGDWVEDPSNNSPEYLRTAARELLSVLTGQKWDGESMKRVAPSDKPLIKTSEIAQICRYLLHVQSSADFNVDMFLQRHAWIVDRFGFCYIDLPALAMLSPELANRVISRTISCIGGGDFQPRLNSIRNLIRVIQSRYETASSSSMFDPSHRHVSVTLGKCLLTEVSQLRSMAPLPLPVNDQISSRFINNDQMPGMNKHKARSGKFGKAFGLMEFREWQQRQLFQDIDLGVSTPEKSLFDYHLLKPNVNGQSSSMIDSVQDSSHYPVLVVSREPSPETFTRVRVPIMSLPGTVTLSTEDESGRRALWWLSRFTIEAKYISSYDKKSLCISGMTSGAPMSGTSWSASFVIGLPKGSELYIRALKTTDWDVLQSLFLLNPALGPYALQNVMRTWRHLPDPCRRCLPLLVTVTSAKDGTSTSTETIVAAPTLGFWHSPLSVAKQQLDQVSFISATVRFCPRHQWLSKLIVNPPKHLPAFMPNTGFSNNQHRGNSERRRGDWHSRPDGRTSAWQ